MFFLNYKKHLKTFVWTFPKNNDESELLFSDTTDSYITKKGEHP